MTIQNIIEDFEKALWGGQHPDILEYVQRSPKDKRPAFFLLLEELKDFHEDAMSIEIHESVLKKIYNNFEKEIHKEKTIVSKIWTLKDFFELPQRLGKQWEDLEKVFKIPAPKLEQLANDLTPLGKPNDFGKVKRLELSKKYSIDFSLINKVVNRAFSAIRILESKPTQVYTRSKADDVGHFEEIKEKLIEAIFQEDINL